MYRRILQLILSSSVVCALLLGMLRHDMHSVSAPAEQYSYLDVNSEGQLILTKYPDLPEQVVRRRLSELAAALPKDTVIDCNEIGNADSIRIRTCAESALQKKQP